MATQHHTRLSLRIIEALRNSFDTALFFATMAVKENFRNHVARAGAIGMNPARRIAILGNGPALRHEMPVIRREAEQQACRLCRYVGGTLTDPVLQTALTGLADKHYERFNNLLNVLRD